MKSSHQAKREPPRRSPSSSACTPSLRVHANHRTFPYAHTSAALGSVFKLVAISGVPRIKLSENPEKITIPGRKCAYRLYGSDDSPLLDLMQSADEAPPAVNEPILCRHPFEATRRARVTPSRVELLHRLVSEDFWRFVCAQHDAVG